MQIHESQRAVSFEELGARLPPHGVVRSNEMVLKFWPANTDFEITVFPDGRAIMKGTTDTSVARTLYARYIGS